MEEGPEEKWGPSGEIHQLQNSVHRLQGNLARIWQSLELGSYENLQNSITKWN